MDRALNILNGTAIGKFLIIGFENTELLKNCCFNSRAEFDDDFEKNLNKITEFNERLYNQIQSQLKEQLINAIKFGYTAINWYINIYDTSITIEAIDEKFDTCDICIYYPESFYVCEQVNNLVEEDLKAIKDEVKLNVAWESHFSII